MGLRCLVTGGAGFIGSHVVEHLKQAGYDVTVVDDMSLGSPENIPKDMSYYECNINDTRFWEALEEEEPFQFVFHLAALPRIKPSIENPLPHHEANVNGTVRVLEYCRKHGSKLIFSGSSSIYKGDMLPAPEHASKKPRSPYALQKYICEQYIELYSELYGLNYVTLRYFSVYGERQRLEGSYATVVGLFLGMKADGKPLTITGDGNQRRDFTYVGDVARANVMALNWPRGAYNIGACRNYTVNEVADMVGGEKRYVPARLGEVRETQADNSKAGELGWQPTIYLKEWLDAQRNNS